MNLHEALFSVKLKSYKPQEISALYLQLFKLIMSEELTLDQIGRLGTVSIQCKHLEEKVYTVFYSSLTAYLEEFKKHAKERDRLITQNLRACIYHHPLYDQYEIHEAYNVNLSDPWIIPMMQGGGAKERVYLKHLYRSTHKRHKPKLVKRFEHIKNLLNISSDEIYQKCHEYPNFTELLEITRAENQQLIIH